MSGTRRTGALAAAVVVRAGALFALWLALTDKSDRWEVLTGLACAVLATAVVTAVQVRAGLWFRARPRWVLRALPAPWWVLRDSARVLWAIVARRPAAGRLRAVPFAAGGTTPEDRGRRAVAFALGSLGPNQYAMTESSEDDVLVVHELVPTDEVTAAHLVEEP
jgi:hypothetical protein